MAARRKSPSCVPVLVIRGGNSDILSAETVTAMKERHPAMDVIEVPDQGHVPALAGEALLGDIAAFVAKCDAAANRVGLDPKGAGHTDSQTAAPQQGDRVGSEFCR